MKSRFTLELIHETFDTDDDNIDAIVRIDDVRSFGVTFFTLKNISTLFEKWKISGENFNGSYFSAIDCVIVEKLEYSLLRQVIADMLQQNDMVFEHRHFTRISPPLPGCYLLSPEDSVLTTLDDDLGVSLCVFRGFSDCDVDEMQRRGCLKYAYLLDSTIVEYWPLCFYTPAGIAQEVEKNGHTKEFGLIILQEITLKSFIDTCYSLWQSKYFTHYAPLSVRQMLELYGFTKQQIFRRLGY